MGGFFFCRGSKKLKWGRGNWDLDLELEHFIMYWNRGTSIVSAVRGARKETVLMARVFQEQRKKDGNFFSGAIFFFFWLSAACTIAIFAHGQQITTRQYCQVLERGDHKGSKKKKKMKTQQKQRKLTPPHPPSHP